jgi:hypothetical protein
VSEGKATRIIVFCFDEADERKIEDLTWHGVIDSNIARGDYVENAIVDLTHRPHP